jgi:hypothetical protein
MKQPDLVPVFQNGPWPTRLWNGSVTRAAAV